MLQSTCETINKIIMNYANLRRIVLDLSALGYISSEALETALFTHTMYAEPHLVEAETLQKKLLSSVNQAMAETQL